MGLEVLVSFYRLVLWELLRVLRLLPPEKIRSKLREKSLHGLIQIFKPHGKAGCTFEKSTMNLSSYSSVSTNKNVSQPYKNKLQSRNISKIIAIDHVNVDERYIQNATP